MPRREVLDMAMDGRRHLFPENQAGILHAGPKLSGDHVPQGVWRNLLVPWSLSLAAHVLVFAVLAWFLAERADQDVPAYVQADLVALAEDGPSLPSDTKQAQESKMQEIKAQEINPPRAATRQEPAPVSVNPMAEAVSSTADVLSETELTEMMGAHSQRHDGNAAGGGGGCDVVRGLQHALQRDPKVHAAIEGANRRGKAVLLWNGDWVRSGDQDGKGLSVVREVVMWELAFAPEACRHQRMRGPVVLSLADGATRFVIGAGDWQWSDLLGLDVKR